ncbi:MAG TPA: hypothetical protein VID27_20490, partial [Blastocatellia bacterium]
MKLIIGPPNSGKTREAISRLSDALSHQNKNALLIVPSASSQSIVFDRLESFLCAQNIASNKPRQVVKTFPALYTEILTEAKRAYRVLKKVERDRLIRRTIRELDEQKSLSYFDSIARSAGLVAALSHFIDELWRSGTDEEKFSLIASARDAKDRDIALIFARYRARLQASGLIDVEGAGLEALRALEQRAIKNPADRFSMIVADGFDFYTPVQVGLLSRLSRLGVETMATLTYEEGRAVHLWQEPTRRRFEAAGAEIIELQSSPADEISRAAARLMDDRHSQADDSESAPITIFSAPDRATEVRAAAREIKKLILESRFAPDDITIVCRSLALYSSHLEKIFRECSIPITIDSPLRLDENPAVIALLRLLALSSESFPRRAVIDCLRSPFFDLSRFNLDEQAVNHLDHASIAGNVTRKREQWMEALSAAAERKPEQRSDYFSPKETDKRYPKLLESLDDFFNEVTLPASAAPLLFAQRALHLLESFDIENRAGDENSDATKSLRALLEEMRDDAIESTGEVAQATFYNDLERAIGATVIERDSSSLSVLAQEAHNLRPRRYRAVFVLGLIEGEFPARATERFPYTLVEREQLRSASVDLTETTSDAGADLTQFYKAMASATERLYLAYARTDLAGSELLRSYLVDEIEACARAEKIMIPQQAATFERVRMDEIISLDELALITAREIGRSLDEDRDTSRQARIASSLLEQRMASWRFVWRGAQMERDRLAGTRGRFNGVMESADILEEIRRKFGAHYMWSASQINDYGVCPFRFFARHALRLKPIDEPVEGFVPARLGSA